MNFLKFLLFLVLIGLGAYVIFWLLGIIAGLLWYVFWIGLIGVGGYVGYKLFLGKDDEPAQLEEKIPIGIAEMHDFDRALEEYREKELKK